MEPGDATPGATTRALGRGLAVILGRSVGAQIVSAGALVYVARVLGAHNLGLLALGGLVPGFIDLIAGSGVVAGLLRRPEEPSRAEIGTTVSLEAGAAALAVAVMAALMRIDPHTIKVMMLLTAAYGIDAVRVPAAVSSERGLRFGHLSVATLIEAAVGNGVGVVLVATHRGVVGFAAGSVVGALAGAVYILWAMPKARPVPAWSPTSLRGVLSFGLRFQAVHGTFVARDQLLSYTLLAVGGATLLGYWSFIVGISAPVLLVLNAAWEITYPVMARAQRSGADLSAGMSKALDLTATVSGLLLGCMVGVSRVWIPLIFGPRWHAVIPGIPLWCAGLTVLGPLSVAVPGGLLTSGRVRSVVLAMVVHGVVAMTLIAVLEPPLGFTGVLLALLLGALGESVIVAAACRRALGIDVLALTARAVALGIIVGAAGVGTSLAFGRADLADAGLVAAAVLAASALAAWVLARPSLRSGIYLVRTTLSGGVGGTSGEAPIP